jgi:hypothetical protein
VVYFVYFSCSSLNSTPQTMGQCTPMRSSPSAPPLEHPPYCFRQLSGWLLFKNPKRRPLKARARHISLFFHVPYSDAPIDGTENGVSALNAPGLLQTHTERWRQDIGPWRMLPGRERTKTAGG